MERGRAGTAGDFSSPRNTNLYLLKDIYLHIVYIMKKIFSLLALLMLLGTCSAHQPRITFGEFHPKGNPVIVTHPEISQAFYGDLSGQSDYYQITSDT